MVTFTHTGECLEVIRKKGHMNSVSQTAEDTVDENEAYTPVKKSRAVRHRKQKIMTKLGDSGFEEDFPSPTPSPVRTPRCPGAPRSPNRLRSNWRHHYGEIGYKIQKENETHFHPFKCLSRQPQVTAEARCKLVSWLIPVHRHFRLSFECCCLAVNIMDRFLASTPVAADCFQLLGVTALLLASKQVEVFSPRISQLLSLCCDAFSREQLCNLECLVLLRLNFRLAAPTLAFFLDHYTNHSAAAQQAGRDVDNYWLAEDNEGAEKSQWDAGRCSSLARRVCELSLADYAFNKYPPSLTARSALWLANELLETQDPHEPMDQSQTPEPDGAEDQQSHGVGVRVNPCMSENDHATVDDAQTSMDNDPNLSVGHAPSDNGHTPSATDHIPSEVGPAPFAEEHPRFVNDLAPIQTDHAQTLSQECRENLKLLVSLNEEALQAMMIL